MGVDHSCFYDYFLLVFVYFEVKLEKDKYRDFILSQVVA